MFAVRLDHEEKRAFMALALDLLQADGRAASTEEAVLEALSLETGVGRSEALKGKSISELLAFFKTRNSKTAVILELIGLALCDVEYHSAERELIRTTAEELGFSSAELLAMENWVLRQIALVREAEGFFRVEVGT